MEPLPPGYADSNGGPQRHGTAFEMMFAAQLILRGAEVAFPLTHFSGYDLICVSDKGKILVDVKHTKGDVKSRVRTDYTGCEVYAVYSKGNWYIVPADKVRNRATMSVMKIHRWLDRWDLLVTGPRKWKKPRTRTRNAKTQQDKDPES